ncbi:MAG: PIN domain-containing protein [Rhizobacter sp.]|nr:PIN domain-containing protein [Rhizobacter sp.]
MMLSTDPLGTALASEPEVQEADGRRAATPASAPILVLDTNVVLDWLVFDDPGAAVVRAAITSGRVRWLASAAMREELQSVLGRPALQAWCPSPHPVLATWQRWVTMVEPERTPAVARAPRCADPDDQKFIDLALQLGAHALLSRDRAVLRLTRPARSLGLQITTAARWGSQTDR